MIPLDRKLEAHWREIKVWDHEVLEAERKASALEGNEIACEQAQEAVVMAKVQRSEALADYLVATGISEKTVRLMDERRLERMVIDAETARQRRIAAQRRTAA